MILVIQYSDDCSSENSSYGIRNIKSSITLTLLKSTHNVLVPWNMLKIISNLGTELIKWTFTI